MLIRPRPRRWRPRIRVRPRLGRAAGVLSPLRRRGWGRGIAGFQVFAFDRMVALAVGMVRGVGLDRHGGLA